MNSLKKGFYFVALILLILMIATITFEGIFTSSGMKMMAVLSICMFYIYGQLYHDDDELHIYHETTIPNDKNNIVESENKIVESEDSSPEK